MERAMTVDNPNGNAGMFDVIEVRAASLLNCCGTKGPSVSTGSTTDCQAAPVHR